MNESIDILCERWTNFMESTAEYRKQNDARNDCIKNTLERTNKELLVINANPSIPPPLVDIAELKKMEGTTIKED